MDSSREASDFGSDAIDISDIESEVCIPHPLWFSLSFPSFTFHAAFEVLVYPFSQRFLPDFLTPPQGVLCHPGSEGTPARDEPQKKLAAAALCQRHTIPHLFA